MLTFTIAFILGCVDTSKTEHQEDTILDTGNEHQGDTSQEDDTDSGEDDTDSGEDDTDSGEDDPPQEDCPDGVTCIYNFPYLDTATTIGSGISNFDSYSCAPTTNESGEEVIYRLDIPDDGFLALSLQNVQNGADIDIHLLENLDTDDCIDRGHWNAGAFVTAGQYWVIADTWVNSNGEELSGSYTLQVGVTTVSDLENSGMQTDFSYDSLYAYDVAWAAGDTDRFEYAITDFSLHSSEERMWLLDLSDGSVLNNYHIAHGEASSSLSDDGFADSFSNINNSHQSSLGMMKAAESYTGTYGYSMRLDGLEYGYNDNVRSRYIVMHGWEGSRPEYVNYWGSVAPTWGCPAVDDRDVADVVDTLKDGALMFFWYPDGDWNVNSSFLP
jgi:hypothetical protein